MKRILITGSGGFLGSRIKACLKGHTDWEIYGTGRESLDLTDPVSLEYVFLESRPDVVIHCAAISDTGYAQKHPEESWEINVAGSVHIADICAREKIKLIYMSSDQIYNGCLQEGELTETECVAPESVYACHKWEAEKQIGSILPEAVGLRLTWLYDMPNRKLRTNSNLIWNLLRAEVSDQTVAFPVREYRGITYVWNLVEQMERIVDLPGGIYNCGSSADGNTYQTALFAARQLGIARPESKVLADTERFSEHIRNLNINNGKLKEFGIVFPGTYEGITLCLNEYGLIF